MWEHGVHVLVSLSLPDSKEKVRGVGGRGGGKMCGSGVGQRKEEYAVVPCGRGAGRDFGS